jgi:hypothetical protein
VLTNFNEMFSRAVILNEAKDRPKDPTSHKPIRVILASIGSFLALPGMNNSAHDCPKF